MGAGWHLVLELSGGRRHPCPRAACHAVLEASPTRGCSGISSQSPSEVSCLGDDEDWLGGSEPELVVEGTFTRGDPVQAIRAVEGSWLPAGSGLAWDVRAMRIEELGGGHLTWRLGRTSTVQVDRAD